MMMKYIKFTVYGLYKPTRVTIALLFSTWVSWLYFWHSSVRQHTNSRPGTTTSSWTMDTSSDKPPRSCPSSRWTSSARFSRSTWPSWGAVGVQCPHTNIFRVSFRSCVSIVNDNILRTQGLFCSARNVETSDIRASTSMCHLDLSSVVIVSFTISNIDSIYIISQSARSVVVVNC